MSKIIIYDFDGTLTQAPVADFEILVRSGVDKPSSNRLYIDKINKKVDENNMNLYEAIYTLYLETIKKAGFELNDDNFSLGADKFVYNKGVFEFLDYMKSNNVKNYIVSSSIKVLLDKTKVACFFEEIYATTFKYNNDIAYGIDYLVSDVEKVEVIKKILKDNKMNDCSNVIYIGDGLTDYYAMEYVKKNGGSSIYIYYNVEDRNIDVMRKKNVVDLFTEANYSLDSKLTNYVKKKLM